MPTDGLGAQLYVGKRQPRAASLLPPHNRNVKPAGGLWTSTYLGPGQGSSWVQWDRGEHMGWTDRTKTEWWLLTPDPASRVLTIDSRTDLLLAFERYPYVVGPSAGYHFTYLDFEALAADYDAIHLTDEGQWQTRLPPDGPDLYGWDCESTLWLRWMFSTRAVRVEPRG